MVITNEMAVHVAGLAHLGLAEDQVEQARADLARMVEWVGQLEQVDTREIRPLLHGGAGANVLREDEIRPGIDAADLLRNAPEQKEDCFLVPRTFE